MGWPRTRLAGALGWAGSLALHLTVALSAVGVIPLAEGLSTLAASARDAKDEPSPEPPDPTKAEGREEPPQAAAPEPPKPLSVALPEPPPAETLETPREPEPEEVRLGIDESTATETDTWLGFAEATPEHGGMPRGYEQAQLTRAPGERSAALDLAAGLGAGEPSNASAPTGAPGDSFVPGEGGEDDEAREGADATSAFVAASALPTITLAPAREERDVAADNAALARAPGAGAAGSAAQRVAAAVEQATATLEALRRRGERGLAAAPPGGARPVDETARPAAGAEPLDAQGAGGEESASGFLSDRDSDAAALKQAIAVNPGKPLAAKGLRIQTVRPKWSTYTLATANPNDVVVRIWFDWTGRVTNARIIQSSGRDDVDRPILDAVYNWRATGEQLAKIRQQPDGRVQLVFKIDLTR